MKRKDVVQVSNIENSQLFVYRGGEPYGYIAFKTMYMLPHLDDSGREAIEREIQTQITSTRNNNQLSTKAQFSKESFDQWLERVRQLLLKRNTFDTRLRMYCNQIMYGSKDGIFEAKGGVLVEDRDTKISSNTLRFELDSGKAYLSGKTKVTWPRGDVHAKSCTYDIHQGQLSCLDTSGRVHLLASRRSEDNKYPVFKNVNSQRHSGIYHVDSIFQILEYHAPDWNTGNYQKHRKAPKKAPFETTNLFLCSKQLTLKRTEEKEIGNEWIAKDAKVYCPQKPDGESSEDILLPSWNKFSVHAKQISYAHEGKDLNLKQAKFQLGEKLVIPYLTQHVCLEGAPFGGFEVGYNYPDVQGYYISVRIIFQNKPLIQPLWFAKNRGHAHVAGIIGLSRRKTFGQRFALASSVSWRNKEADVCISGDITLFPEFSSGRHDDTNESFSYWEPTNPTKTFQHPTSSTLSSHTFPSLSRASRSFVYATPISADSSYDVKNTSIWNICRGHFELEKQTKKWRGKWIVYGNWRTQVFNPASAYLEDMTGDANASGIESAKVSEWRELRHRLGLLFSTNPSSTVVANGKGQFTKQMELGIESLSADRLQEAEYTYGFGLSDERQESQQRSFASLQTEYRHVLWREKPPLVEEKKELNRLPSYLSAASQLHLRTEKLRGRPISLRATTRIGVQGQMGKMRKSLGDFTGFYAHVSRTFGELSTFLFEREEQRTALHLGIVQHIFGSFRLGLERRWTYAAAASWEPMETKVSFNLTRDSFHITTSYLPEQGTATISCRWLW
eukprot:jgi/Galph1/2298/GphlegSOOS_G987.1